MMAKLKFQQPLLQSSVSHDIYIYLSIHLQTFERYCIFMTEFSAEIIFPLMYGLLWSGNMWKSGIWGSNKI